MTSTMDHRGLGRIEALREIVGKTPLLAITFRYRNAVRTLYAKAEYFNPTGSIKDRMALHILCSAYAQGQLHAGDPIVEATSGNSGIALAAMGSAIGHPVVIYMPDWMSEERVKLIQSYGAQVIAVSKEQGGFLGSIRLTQQHQVRDSHAFLPRQFSNAANVQAHALTTGPEILQQLWERRLTLDAFVAGVGTGGTIMGVAACLRAAGSKAKVHPVEPLESPTLSTGYRVGFHRIQGISDEFIPEILNLSTLDEIISVSDGDSILMAQKLASTLGLGVGISSGCNFLAAVMAQNRLAENAVVATVFCDDNKKYLSTDLTKIERIENNYISSAVELLDFSVTP